MQLIDCDQSHLDAIRAIYNNEVETATTFYEDEPRSAAYMQDWYDAKASVGLPIIGAVDDDGTLLGFDTYGPFRPQVGYRHTIEHSVYVQKDHRGKGISRVLMRALMERAKTAGLKTIVGVIDAGNTASRHLHESEGFVLQGTLPRVGQKFDQWLDMCLYTRELG